MTLNEALNIVKRQKLYVDFKIKATIHPKDYSQALAVLIKFVEDNKEN